MLDLVARVPADDYIVLLMELDCRAAASRWALQRLMRSLERRPSYESRALRAQSGPEAPTRTVGAAAVAKWRSGCGSAHPHWDESANATPGRAAWFARGLSLRGRMGSGQSAGAADITSEPHPVLHALTKPKTSHANRISSGTISPVYRYRLRRGRRGGGGVATRESALAACRARVSIVIDGTLEESEWRGSAVVRRPEGDVLLRHDGRTCTLACERFVAAFRVSALRTATPSACALVVRARRRHI